LVLKEKNRGCQKCERLSDKLWVLISFELVIYVNENVNSVSSVGKGVKNILNQN